MSYIYINLNIYRLPSEPRWKRKLSVNWLVYVQLDYPEIARSDIWRQQMIWLSATVGGVLAFCIVLKLIVLQSISHYSPFFFCLRRCYEVTSTARACWWKVYGFSNWTDLNPTKREGCAGFTATVGFFRSPTHNPLFVVIMDSLWYLYYSADQTP